MTGRLDGKVAVITGGGNGIGRACAVRFAEEGAAVLVADLLTEPGRETVQLVEKAGGRAVFVPVDVTSRNDIDTMALTAVEELGGLDVVVTAAGISHANYSSGDMAAEIKTAAETVATLDNRPRAFVEGSMEAFEKVLAVNLIGTYQSIQACAARMLASNTPGSIITIASIGAKDPDAGLLAYTTSKAAVWMLTKKAARELAPAGIRVNALGPGFIETNMTSIIGMMQPEDRARFEARIPLGRPGQPVEIANSALFLAGDESSYFTGEILHPDGGWFTG